MVVVVVVLVVVVVVVVVVAAAAAAGWHAGALYPVITAYDSAGTGRLAAALRACICRSTH